MWAAALPQSPCHSRSAAAVFPPHALRRASMCLPLLSCPSRERVASSPSSLPESLDVSEELWGRNVGSGNGGRGERGPRAVLRAEGRIADRDPHPPAGEAGASPRALDASGQSGSATPQEIELPSPGTGDAGGQGSGHAGSGGRSRGGSGGDGSIGRQGSIGGDAPIVAGSLGGTRRTLGVEDDSESESGGDSGSGIGSVSEARSSESGEGWGERPQRGAGVEARWGKYRPVARPQGM